MTKRNFYQPKNKTVSIQNEPFLPDHQDIARYPDMYEVYRAFGETYSLYDYNFILTNGCENAFRIALLALRPDKIKIESPTWAMASIIAESFKIPYESVQYHYINNQFCFDNCDKTDTWFYTTGKYNNLFCHKNYNPDSYSHVILDETYTMRYLLDYNRNLDRDKIIIGSFSKFAGCGLRLGYILFHSSRADDFHMLRESYISLPAADFIIKRQKPEVNLEQNWQYPIVTQHPCYTTYIENPNINIPHKEFIVDNIKFYRYGTIYQ